MLLVAVRVGSGPWGGGVCQVSVASGTGKRVPDAGRQTSENDVVFITWGSPNSGCDQWEHTQNGRE